MVKTLIPGGMIDNCGYQTGPHQYSPGRGPDRILFRDVTASSVRKVPGMVNRWRGFEHDGPGARKKSRREEWKSKLLECLKRNPFTTVFLIVDTIMLSWLVWVTVR